MNLNQSRPAPTEIKTLFTELVGCRLPIIGGPMFLVSDEDLVVAVSEAGGLGGVPSLNWRKSEDFQAAVRAIKTRTNAPFAVNLIVNKSNPRQKADLEICAEERVPVVITSLGNPKEVIRTMHAAGSKVFCDVTTLGHARKVQDLGADAVIAVCSGAGGHAGPISPVVFIPYLKKHLSIPIVAAGGVSNGRQLAALRILGAEAVQIGTRLIASVEAKVSQKYKEAIVKSAPEDILMTRKISGTPCSIIKTPYVEKIGLELNLLEKALFRLPRTRKWVRMLRYGLGARALKRAVATPTWKEVWSAGQGVGLIHSILPIKEIINQIALEYQDALK